MWIGFIYLDTNPHPKTEIMSADFEFKVLLYYLNQAFI